MHDVLGLYEVIDKFSKDVWEATTLYRNNKERFVKDVLEAISEKKFEKKRPEWLKTDDGKRLELDCYNEELKIAVEYNGDQHYKLCKFNKFDENKLKEIKQFEEVKKIKCQEQDIKLLIIPFWKTHDEIVDIIKKLLNSTKEIDTEIFGRRTTGINITDCLTGASLSKKYFFLKFYNREKFPVWTLDDETDKFIRDGYFGGRVEIFHYKYGNSDKYYYYDFTSLFPAMATKILPYGEPKRIKGNEIDINNFFGFIKCKVTTIRKNIKPLHAMMQKGKLLFKHLNNNEIVLFSEEIKQGLSNNQYNYEFIEGIEFKAGHIMKDMSEEVFKMKSLAKEQGKDALSLVWKIILNSSYGFWGLRTKDRDAIKIYPVGQAPVNSYMNSGKLKDESDIGNYTILRILNDLEVTDFNVGIACAITSYARCELWNLINDIESKGDKVYMCDTDSVVCNLDLNDYPDIKNRYQWDSCGDELGCVKNELNSDVLKKKKKELSKEELNNIKYNQNLYYDKAIFNGAKYYAMISEKWDIEVAKCKGFKKTEDFKLKFKHFDEPLEQDVDQFICGLQGYVNETKAFKIKLKTISKKIKPKYNKAFINQDNTIRPYEADEIII